MQVKRSVLLMASAMVLASCAATPPAQTVETNGVWMEQGWTDAERQKFHYITQGTSTLPIPFDWFDSLEQPGIWNGLQGKLLSDPDYLPESLGFIPGNPDRQVNRSGLPVGFALMDDFYNPILERKVTALGLTCAACHTGQMEYQGQALYFDGGPAMSDLTGLTKVLMRTMLETRLIPTRFDRFARRVLGEQYSAATSKQLKKDMTTTIKVLLKAALEGLEAKDHAALDEALASDNNKASIIKRVRVALKQNASLEEGFTRLDALNRIGNAVFSSDLQNPANNHATNAPVNYPHIWTTSWFDWVQYDGSVMQPMVRNAGESLGVSAGVNLKPTPDGKPVPQFASTIPLDNLDWMETLLAGKENPYEQKKLGGLQAPEWPEKILPPIDKGLAAKGEQLYVENCEKCHMPPVNSARFWQESVWAAKGTADNRLIAMNLIPLDEVGTDSAQADVLQTRKVNISQMEMDPETSIYLVPDYALKGLAGDKSDQAYNAGGKYNGGCQPFPMSKLVDDKGNVLFAAALGATVQEVNNFWYNTHDVTGAEKQRMDGDRLNCLQAGAGYKARPLNGIWATAPFLHNGSVPTLYHMLSPVAERPENIFLGSLEFDPIMVGYKYDQGPFQLNTAQQGNTNVGHEFTDARTGKGVIGRGLGEDERWALVEYLKTL